MRGPVLILAALALAGCASSGPTAPELISGAARAQYQVVDLDPALARQLSPPAPAAAAMSALDTAPPSEPFDVLRPGDLLEITIFEVGASLFAAPAAGPFDPNAPPTAGGQTLPPVRIDDNGDITLPYLGRVAAAGRTPAQLQAWIERALKGKSQSPQAVVAVKEGVGNSVIVMGDVKAPGRRPLTASHERVLDMLALAGGAANPKQDSWLRLSRGGRTAEVRIADLAVDSAENIVLRPQDRLEVIWRPRSFTAFGASGHVSETPFQSAEVSLAEAVARVGGPLDQQADPSAVFVFRAAPGSAPVIYRVDLSRPDGYFAAQAFQMRDKDLIYIANARTNGLAKFLAMINAAAAPIVTTRQLTR